MIVFTFCVCCHIGKYEEVVTWQTITWCFPSIQRFLIFCVMGFQLIAYPLIGVLTRFFPKDK